VLDVSMAKNTAALQAALNAGAHVFTPTIIKQVKFRVAKLASPY